jgi:histidine ammonia-lyase/phenylalanine ammonia-lyase
MVSLAAFSFPGSLFRDVLRGAERARLRRVEGVDFGSVTNGVHESGDRRETRGVVRPQQTVLEIDGASLTIEDALEVAARRRVVRLSDRAARNVRESREVKLRLIASGVPLYGVTTGFGDSADRQIDASRASGLQENLLRFLGCGTGTFAPPEATRVAMVLRANCLAKGNSGVRQEVIDQILAFLAADALPLIPERGSCGASGDLIPLSYLGRALTGEQQMAFRGEVVSAAEVLAELRLAPLRLEAKEGLALTNGTSFMTAFACLAVGAARQLADLADILTAMTSEAVLGNSEHFDGFLFDVKPHPGMVASAQNIRELLAGSMLSVERVEEPVDLAAQACVRLARHVQDRYSIRCAPHVVGVLRDTLEWVERWIRVEINSSDDNPLFNTLDGSVHSGGNFYGGHIGQAMDALKVALASLCDLIDRQLALVVDEKFNAGLPPNLTAPVSLDHGEAGLHHGFKGMQLCCSAMAAEALKLSNPATIHSRSTEAHNQDKVSMGTIAARDARSITELAVPIAAIHLIALCQALELRGLRMASPRTRAVYEVVRAHIPFVDQDRPLDRDIDVAVELVRSGAATCAAGLDSRLPAYAADTDLR